MILGAVIGRVKPGPKPPTIVEAKRRCRALFGRLPRCGCEVEVETETDASGQSTRRVFLQNNGGRHKVRVWHAVPRPPYV